MAESLPGKRLTTAATMLRFAWAADPKRSLLALVLFTLQALASTTFAWWLKVLLDAVPAADLTNLFLATGGLALSLAGNTVLSHGSNQVLLALRERTHALVERRMVEIVGHTPTLDIHETPAYLTHLEVLERETWRFGETVPSLVNLFATGIRIVTTTALLVTVSPALLLLAVLGLPTLLLSSKISRLYHLGNDRTAEIYRRTAVLYDLATKSECAKETRLLRLGPVLVRRFHVEYRKLIGVSRRVAVHAEALGLAGRMIFLLGYFCSLLLVVHWFATGRASIGDVALTAVLAGQILSLLASSAELLQFAWRNLATAGRYVELEGISRQARSRSTAAAVTPARLRDGIRLDQVSYRYPHSTRPALRGIDLRLPAGSTVAVVGDNGAGKTTLVKLLTGLYLPTDGKISIDGVDLATLDPESWRRRTSAGFQDHARFELPLREAIGIGDLDAIEDEAAVRTALQRAGSADLPAALPAGLQTQLGPSWTDGVDLSGGQWQKIAISRAMMRTAPLLLVLDEPTAALDADTEHRLFRQWATASERIKDTSGAITILVSHRFSTVRMADLIIVLDHGELIETGDHDELMARGGLYADLFELQARSYR
ncbi:ABC transporter ATP-binding protein [Microlunatus parietis]|nr:ABC transporter ATP-binding protein [Microlunatus parietis]